MNSFIDETKEFLANWKWTFIFIASIIILRMFILNWYIVPSSSMNPVLKEGDITTVNLIAYDFKVPFTDSKIDISEPEYADVIAIKLDQYYVKRIVAKPNDRIKMINNQIFVNNMPIEQYDSDFDISNLKAVQEDNLHFYKKTEKFNGKEYNLIFADGITDNNKIIPFTKEIKDSIISNFDEIKLGNDEYFVLGDNRNNSKDSRFLGTIKRNQIVGKVNYVLFNKNSFDRFITNIQ